MITFRDSLVWVLDGMDGFSRVCTRWAPTTHKWSCNPYKRPYKWVTGLITQPISRVINLLITGRDPPCTSFQYSSTGYLHMLKGMLREISRYLAAPKHHLVVPKILTWLAGKTTMNESMVFPCLSYWTWGIFQQKPCQFSRVYVFTWKITKHEWVDVSPIKHWVIFHLPSLKLTGIAPEKLMVGRQSFLLWISVLAGANC